jgi:ESCRT-I complex subunit VPS37
VLFIIIEEIIKETYIQLRFKTIIMEILSACHNFFFCIDIRIAFIIVQCTIIRTTELAAAQDRLADLERQRDEVMKSYSPAALLDKLQKLMAKLDEESEELHQKFLEKDIDLPTFVQKHKKLRTAYHKQALLHLAGKTSVR